MGHEPCRLFSIISLRIAFYNETECWGPWPGLAHSDKSRLRFFIPPPGGLPWEAPGPSSGDLRLDIVAKSAQAAPEMAQEAPKVGPEASEMAQETSEMAQQTP